MKICTSPSVRLVGRMTLDKEAVNAFLADEGVIWESDSQNDEEKIVETAGRICYMSFSKPRPGGNKAYIDNIISTGHGSVLEHTWWSFILSGVSRSFSHELVRHRAGVAYSQLSQRYVDESTAEYVIPWLINKYPNLQEIWKRAVGQSHEAYLQLVAALMETEEVKEELKAGGNTPARKMARQAARSVLPNATETKLFFSANARALRHIIEMRGAKPAETEIRMFANQVLDLMRYEAPNIFADYKETALPDGTFDTTTPYRKV